MSKLLERRRLPGVLTTAGGAILVASVPLVWITASFAKGDHNKTMAATTAFRGVANAAVKGTNALKASSTVSFSGFSLLAGKVAFAAGILLILIGGAMWFASRDGRRASLAIAVMVIAVIALSLTLYRALANPTEISKAAAKHKKSGASFGRTAGPGLYLALGGGVIALLGGGLGASRWSARSAASQTGGGGAGTPNGQIESTTPVPAEAPTEELGVSAAVFAGTEQMGQTAQVPSARSESRQARPPGPES